MSSDAARMHKARALLQQYYGYDAFRTGQENTIASILHGRDTVSIMPTGGGKSICYQIPALVYDRLTLVISPLISLMKDQVDALQHVGISATFINSTLGIKEVRQRLHNAERGEYQLLYIAPERLESEGFVSLLQTLRPALVAIDEAHCLSQWGHDFRKSYLSIAPFLEQLDPRPIVAAFTATATPEVITDICEQLYMSDPHIVVTGFDRANLRFSVRTGQDKRTFVSEYLSLHREEAGIIYATTRKEVDSLSEWLKKKGYAVGRYHAGMTDDERSISQEQFLYDETRVMVATNAFGMGIDKSNVRFVIHYNMPKNIEAYYQEAGRAGRDGDSGECILLYSAQDIQVQKFLIEQSELPPDRKRYEYQKLQAMADYCHTSQCLRAYILRYFGEKDTVEHCGYCINCEDDFLRQDITVIAQQIFSCIFRVKERFGMTMIAAILKGSKDKRLMQLGLDQMTTYGLMRGITEKEIIGYIQTLVADGYIKVTAGQYPVLLLQSKAAAVLKNEVQVFIKVFQKKEVAMPDDQLFEQLRAWRKVLSQRENVPPYVIFSDHTLRELAAMQPTTHDAMRAVKGIGEVKLARYGDEVLAMIRAYTRSSVTTGSEL